MSEKSARLGLAAVVIPAALLAGCAVQPAPAPPPPPQPVYTPAPAPAPAYVPAVRG
jgi:hypothetical protein